MKIEIGISKDVGGIIDVGIRMELIRTSEMDESQIGSMLESDFSSIRDKLFSFYKNKGFKIKSDNSKSGLI